MLESILVETTEAATLTMQTTLLCSLVSIVLGIVIAFAYMLSSKNYSQNYVGTLVILPILVQVVIMMVNGNLGTGVAILGAFSLVRFRSIPGSSKEISGVFFAMAIGLAMGMGYMGFAVMITIIVSLLFLLLKVTNFGAKKTDTKLLKITIPENLNYTDLFDDIFETFTKKAELDRVKTTNLGSMFELVYRIQIVDQKREKEMLDEIRCRNGNLSISISKMENQLEEL